MGCPIYSYEYEPDKVKIYLSASPTTSSTTSLGSSRTCSTPTRSTGTRTCSTSTSLKNLCDSPTRIGTKTDQFFLGYYVYFFFNGREESNCMTVNQEKAVWRARNLLALSHCLCPVWGL